MHIAAGAHHQVLMFINLQTQSCHPCGNASSWFSANRNFLSSEINSSLSSFLVTQLSVMSLLPNWKVLWRIKGANIQGECLTQNQH